MLAAFAAAAEGWTVREEKALSLEEAVRKMASLPADRFKLSGRGRIAEGAFADIVVFDHGASRMSPHMWSRANIPLASTMCWSTAALPRKADSRSRAVPDAFYGEGESDRSSDPETQPHYRQLLSDQDTPFG